MLDIRQHHVGGRLRSCISVCQRRRAGVTIAITDWYGSAELSCIRQSGAAAVAVPPPTVVVVADISSLRRVINVTVGAPGAGPAAAAAGICHNDSEVVNAVSGCTAVTTIAVVVVER